MKISGELKKKKADFQDSALRGVRCEPFPRDRVACEGIPELP